MMISKRNLRKRVVLGDKTNQDLKVKKSSTNEKDVKKTYNLRKTDKLDNENENRDLQINVKKSCMLKSTVDVPNLQSKSNNVNNENKFKLRGKRQVIKFDNISKTKSIVSNGEIVKKNNVKDKENSKDDIVSCETGTFPIWRKNLPNSKKESTQKKNFDIYDMSEDEDLSHVVSGLPKKLKKKSRKNVKRIFDRNFVSKKGLKSTVGKNDPKPNKFKRTKSVQPKSNPSSNMPIPVKDAELLSQTCEESPEKPCFEVENNKLSLPEDPDVTEINILEPLNSEDVPPELANQANITLLMNIADVFKKFAMHPKMTSTPDTAVVMAAVPPKNDNLILNNISHIASNDRNIVRVIIDTPDPLPAKTSEKAADLPFFKLPEPKKIKSTKLKSPVKPVPKMTSTPDTAALDADLSNLNDISHIPSTNRNIMQVIIDTPDPLPTKKSSKRGTDITLFESPEPKKKNPVKSKSPQKPVRINLIENFLLSPVKNLEASVKKPVKAYHTPDNFKNHLARTKRVSEGMKTEKRKSKEDLLIEQLAKHFEEISSTDLYIE